MDIHERLFGRSSLDRAVQGGFDEADDVAVLTGPMDDGTAIAFSDWQRWQDQDSAVEWPTDDDDDDD